MKRIANCGCASAPIPTPKISDVTSMKETEPKDEAEVSPFGAYFAGPSAASASFAGITPPSDAQTIARSKPIPTTIMSPSVSYTHLRAHETRHDLVCRLLLEK